MREDPGDILFLLSFHLRVGARVALRALAPVVSAFLFFYYILRFEFAAFFSRVLLFENGLLISGLTLALAALAAAKAASARVTLGAAGWFRSLPQTSGVHRRLVVIGTAVACVPVLGILGFLTVIGAREAGRPAGWLLVGLPLLGLSAVLFWTPVRHPWRARPLAFLSCLLAGSGNWVLLAAGAACLAAADAAAGPLRRAGRAPLFKPYGKNPGLPYLIALRAVGAKFVPLYLTAFLVMILSRLFVLNNRLGGPLATAAMRFGGTLSLTLFVAFLASVLAGRRPPWPWFRSLPLSSRARVLIDSVFLTVPALSVAAIAVALDPRAALPVLSALPALSLRAATAMRRSPGLRAGPVFPVLIEGGLAALLSALSPWTSLLYLAAAPPALTLAVQEERRTKVSLWAEIHHLAAGDPQSWSST